MQNEAIKILEQQKQALVKEINTIERAITILRGDTPSENKEETQPKKTENRVQKSLNKKSTKIPVKKLILEALTDLKTADVEQLSVYLVNKQGLKSKEAEKLRNNISVTSSTLLKEGEIKVEKKEGKKNIFALAA